MTLWMIFYHLVYLQETEMEFQSHLEKLLTHFVSGYCCLKKGLRHFLYQPDCVFKQLMSEFSDVMSTSSFGKFNTSLIGLVILNVSSITPLFLNSAISFSNDS